MLHLNLQPKEFYELTPFEFNTMLDCIEYRQIDKYNEMISNAWHNAALQRQKKLASLKSLLKKYKPKKKPQNVSKDELMEIARNKGVI